MIDIRVIGLALSIFLIIFIYRIYRYIRDYDLDIVSVAKITFYIYIFIVFYDVVGGERPSDIIDRFYDVMLVCLILIALSHIIEILFDSQDKLESWLKGL